MARPLRLEYEDAVYHLTSRGNSGTEIFLDDVDRMRFLEILTTLEELFVDATDKVTRNQLIHSAVRTHQYRLKEVGDYLGLCYSTISVIAKRVEQNAQP